MVINKYELIRETVSSYMYDCSVDHPDQVADFLRDCLKMDKKDREQFITLSLDVKGNIIGVAVESVGDISSSIVAPREVFKQAIISNAAGVIVAHNHPSGDPTPSADDKSTTERLKAAGDILGIRVLDHIIIGAGRHVSLSNMGLM